MGYVLIIGAKSDIAKAIAKEYANNGYDLYLAARGVNKLESFAGSIMVKTQRNIKLVELDILDYKSHQDFFIQVNENLVGVISAVGYLGDQKVAQHDFSEATKIIDTNYTGIVSLFNIIADDFEKRRCGFIVGISSVAGDRGRKSNYIYGSAKAALTTYLSGLRSRLHNVQVHVLTVKPGFVDTKMTRGMDLSKKLTAQPEEVAADIYVAQKKKESVLYTKWIWKWIMIAIKTVPEWKFKGMNI
jgi:short-subunit dehydrogenase